MYPSVSRFDQSIPGCDVYPYPFSQVASFFRVLAAKLLLLRVIFISAVTTHYLIDVWTREKGIFQLLCHIYSVPLRWLLNLFQICFDLTNILP